MENQGLIWSHFSTGTETSGGIFQRRFFRCDISKMVLSVGYYRGGSFSGIFRDGSFVATFDRWFFP
jgi:hypothetical protein